MVTHLPSFAVSDYWANGLLEPLNGVIEAVGDPTRHFYVGVQWHPERTENEQLGAKLIADLVEATTRQRVRV